MNLLTGPTLPPKSGNAAQQLVIFFHGLGADGNDLIGLAPYFADILPDAEFLSPHAPDLCDMGPPGFQSGFQWFSLQDRTPQKILAGLDAVTPQINHFIDTELARRNLHDHNLSLVGFSQGGMLAMHVALRRKSACSSVISFSGALMGADRMMHDIRTRPRTLLIHGEQDDVVPFTSMQAAEGVLRALSVSVTAVSRPQLGHSIDQVGLEKAAGFMQAGFLMFG